MQNRLFGGNGSSKGFTNAVTLGTGWVLLAASQSDPPPPDELPFALSQALEQWVKSKPTAQIRSTLGIVRGGHTIGIHVWFDEWSP
jgi:hypothetical protein